MNWRLFYFDKTTGLLRRLISIWNVTGGRVPVQIDYTDYRDVNGIKFPFESSSRGSTAVHRADQGTQDKRHYRRAKFANRREFINLRTKDSMWLYINRTLDIAWRTA